MNSKEPINPKEIKLLKQANGNQPRTQEEKEQMIAEAEIHYGRFLTALGFDWQADENSANTPHRVAKAWINDIIFGCVNPAPKITSFPNSDKYTGMVVQTYIPVKSLCSHHNLPIMGFAHVAYIPSIDGKVIGLSKLNRLVSFCARRPQLQEAMTKMILDSIDTHCVDNSGVAVMISAKHLCTCHRGVYEDSTMNTMLLSGDFLTNNAGAKDEFLTHIKLAKS